MDDSCAVCAESLEWVAYGSCGHKDVCSTCVARLRFICDDRRCCICKSHCHSVFITKALGDYTRMITDFSVLPSDVKEGRVGSYWYHEDTQAYFDDFDHYKMIKAMCRLSCGVCDKEEQQQQQPSNGSKRRKFRNIGQLKGHLFHQHRLLMCSLCLEGRKVFICEQKLYTRSQLNQHINTGDSAVDGTESERGGFTGHPMCEFCRTPFYGENELYTHMSTDHYTCHICQRQHPGQYEYYKNYDDLETHFRQSHFLCEDEACLAKKFVVFQSEAEMKRHNTLEHGGRMSRSQRSAALQIPTSFRYRRSNEQNDQLRRDWTFRRDRPDAELSVAIQASLQTANTDGFQDRPMSNAQVFTDRETSDVDPIIQPFESLTTDFEPPSRYLQALSHRSRNATLEESSFPPLSMAPDGNQQNPKHDSEGLSKNTMAEHLRRQKNKNMNIVNSAQVWPAAVPTNRASSVINSDQAWPAPSRGPVAQETSPIRTKFSTNIGSGSTSISGQSRVAVSSGSALSSYSSFVQAQPASIKEQSTCSSSSSRSWANSNRISHSSSAPNFAETGSFDSLLSDFPPVSAVQTSKLPSNVQTVPNVEDAQTANKSLVERIRAGVAYDQDKYIAFKDISGQYRQGLIDTRTYLSYVENFGLTHLVLELAKLCPDAQKQRELVEIFNANYFESVPRETENFHLKDDTGFRRGKGKSIASANTQSINNLADNVISTVRKLQSSFKPSEDEAEVLSKDGYRAGKSKSKVISNEPQAELSLINQSFGIGSNATSGDGDVKSNQRKKTPKFLRARLGDGSMAALLHPNKSDTDPEPDFVETASHRNTTPNDGFNVRGVWRQGGGHKLIGKTATKSQ